MASGADGGGTATSTTQPAVPQAQISNGTLQNDLMALQAAAIALTRDVSAIDRNHQSQRNQLQQQKVELEAEYTNKFNILEQEKKKMVQQFQTHREQLEQQNQRRQQEMAQEFGIREGRLQLEREELGKEKKQLEDAQVRIDEIVDQQNPITLEIGGEKFRTQVSTLVRHESSVFPKLLKTLQERSPGRTNNTIFIDRDSKHFRFILNYMRQGEEVIRSSALRNADDYILNEILSEVRFYRLTDLERLVERRRSLNKPASDINALARAGHFTTQIPPQLQALHREHPLKYMTTKELDLRNENLSNIVFDRVYFGHKVSFEGCILTKARFKECTFKAVISFVNADLFEARFEHCQGINNFHRAETQVNRVVFNPPLV